MANYTERSRISAIHTCRSNLGCDWPMQCEAVREKSRKTLTDRYGVDNYAKARYVVDVDLQEELQNGELFGNVIRITAQKTKLCDSRYYSSLIKQLDDQCIDHVIVFPWDDIDKLTQQLQPKQEIFAEQCELYRISTEHTQQFLHQYDYRPLPRGQLLCLGHVWNQHLVQVMTFGKVRNPDKYYIKLIRCVTDPKYAVIGGYNALSTSASIEFGVHDVCVTCDRSKQAFNRLYPLLGMKIVGSQQTTRHIIQGHALYDCGHIMLGT